MNIYIDNNVWNYFFEKNIKIELYFSKEEYLLFITKQGEYEVQQMPASCSELKKYIETSLSLYVSVDCHFGFYNPSLPDDEQRVAGFDQGRFTSHEENIVSSELYLKYGSQKKRKETQILFKQEADIELATSSMGNIVITFDTKKGPLTEAKEKGGKTIFLSYADSLQLSVEKFMNNLLAEIREFQI